jgi:hypothetical protein
MHGSQPRMFMGKFLRASTKASKKVQLVYHILKLGKVMEEKDGAAPTVEKAIQSRRAAMFYGRFKRSKDTTAYSSEDLSCIFGAKEKRPKRLLEDSSTPPTEQVAHVQFRLTIRPRMVIRQPAL